MPQLAHSLCVTPQWIQMMVRRLPWFTTPFSAALILAASAWRPSLPVVPEHGLRPALDLVAAPGWQHPATARIVAPLVLYRFVMVGTLMWMKDQEQQSARRRYAHNRRVNVPDNEKNEKFSWLVLDRLAGDLPSMPVDLMFLASESYSDGWSLDEFQSKAESYKLKSQVISQPSSSPTGN